MKKIREFVIRHHIFTLVAFVFIFFSCTKDEIGRESKMSNIDKNNATNSFTDEDVFKGIMFLEGPLANKLDDFKDLNFRTFINDKAQMDEMLVLQNKIIETIKESNPEFLSNFRAKIGSGDFYQVKYGIVDAANKISDAAFGLLNESKKGGTENDMNKFISLFTSKYKINEQSTKEELLNAIQSMKSDKNTNKVVYPAPYYSVAVWLLAAAAAVIVIVLFLQEAPLPPSPDFYEDPGYIDSEGYLIEKFQSDVTIEFTGI
ncbi:hypothetical protein [Flavobacterium sp. KMS]|jgi:hypothetical protein|uniref:hypothetical protein n=1 Tax=unclassified Flavobacterium TaxID=196869 RepID=UPI00057FDA6A|nr:hypothetical protein [Flavobacterium sp. KMS]KIA94169.1 hypothetical protein OA93_20675 [Flavobacterium sp. KMS]